MMHAQKKMNSGTHHLPIFWSSREASDGGDSGSGDAVGKGDGGTKMRRAGHCASREGGSRRVIEVHSAG